MVAIRPHGAKETSWGWSIDLGFDRDRCEEFGHKILSRRALAGIRAGGFSSIHLHAHQSNAFHVIAGKLVVREYERENFRKAVLASETILFSGDCIVIEAGDMHQFLALEDTRLLEIYVSKPGCDALPDDIQRFSENGCDPDLVLKYV
jgi:mannose-6-phosphate isomerase-like protein (cupin superfamily)